MNDLSSYQITRFFNFINFINLNIYQILKFTTFFNLVLYQDNGGESLQIPSKIFENKNGARVVKICAFGHFKSFNLKVGLRSNRQQIDEFKKIYSLVIFNNFITTLFLFRLEGEGTSWTQSLSKCTFHDFILQTCKLQQQLLFDFSKNAHSS